MNLQPQDEKHSVRSEFPEDSMFDAQSDTRYGGAYASVFLRFSTQKMIRQSLQSQNCGAAKPQEPQSEFNRCSTESPEWSGVEGYFRRHDEGMIRDLDDDINTLLVFVSGTLFAFIPLNFPWH